MSDAVLKNVKTFLLEYRWPECQGVTAFPRRASEICRQLSTAILWHQVTSVLLVVSLLGLFVFFVSPHVGWYSVVVCVMMIILKVWVIATRGVHLNYKMDQNWRNYANMRMAPFTYMSKCVQLWEVTSSSAHYGQEKKYHAGCASSVSRIKVNVDQGLPFPFRTNIKGYVLRLQSARFVFLPDCVYLIQGHRCYPLSYERIKWQISMIDFVESSGAPPDAQIVGLTWQYVNKKGGPDRRFSYNPQFPVCRYGELSLSFDCICNVTLQLSGTKMAEGIMRL